ncbi:MAG: DNA polymerase III subunit beta [Gemmataceae bacterium]|nr:DNA polymerase III subunit beta [Gemmataceae bacterium]
MKAICNREALLSACQVASAAISSKDVKPILKNFKAVAADGRCTLMATDLELGIRIDVAGMVIQEPGEAILPAGKLISILREMRDSEFHLEADADASRITGQAVEFEMPGEDPAHFPDLPLFSDEKYHEVTAGKMREMIRRTVFAAASEMARYTMTGALWEIEKEKMRLVATDGRRLACADGVANCHGGHSIKGQTPVVPSKAMTLLDRNFTDDQETVRISFRPNEVLFKTERAVIYSRLVEGRFPDYKVVFPKKGLAKTTLPVEAFHTAVRQAAIMADDEVKKVVFKFSSKKLVMQAQGSASGRSKVEMDISYQGPAVDIAFNPVFVADLLKVLPDDSEVNLELVDSNSPALFKFADDYQYLIMPLT